MRPINCESCAWTFAVSLQRFVLIPAQVLFQSRKLIIRLLAWRPELPILFRLLDAW